MFKMGAVKSWINGSCNFCLPWESKTMQNSALLLSSKYPLLFSTKRYYRLTNWLMFLCGQLKSPRPDVMPDRREGIARAEGFVAARIETSAS